MAVSQKPAPNQKHCQFLFHLATTSRINNVNISEGGTTDYLQSVETSQAEHINMSTTFWETWPFSF